MKRYKITFSYDGTLFFGYQKQPNKRTIQGEIEKALEYINNKRFTPLSSSGRTDRGVHALNQVGHVDIFVDISEYKLKCALNSLTPEDIHIIKVELVDNNFHSRYMVKSKEYIYKMNLGEYSPLDRNYIYQYNRDLNIEKMRKAIKYFIGTYDFKSFTTNDSNKDTVRTIYSANISLKNNILVIKFKGSGFLKYMVRIMVGALIKVGEEKIEPTEIKNIIEAKNRKKAFYTANSCGLYLYKVNY